MTFQGALLALATLGVSLVLPIFRSKDIDDVGQDEVEAMALLIAMVNVQAAALADLSLADELGTLPLGIGRPDDDLPRLEQSVKTIVEDKEQEPEPRIERLTKAEPMDAGREAYHEAMQERQRWQEEAMWERQRLREEAELERDLARIDREWKEILEPRQIVGWRRQLNPEHCELCGWWSKGGKVFPVDKRMKQHPGCACVPVPVLEEVS